MSRLLGNRWLSALRAPTAIVVKGSILLSVWIASDLHTNAASWSPSAPPHDLLVIAGDVSDGPSKATAELKRIHDLTGKPIVFVPGNHDLIGARLRTGEFDTLSEEIIVLEGGLSVEVKGIRFIGATLWTDFELTETEFASQKWAIAAMPEYQSIRHKNLDRHIWPIDTAEEHARDRAALSRALSVPHEGLTVVVTHHAPSKLSLPVAARNDVSGAAFASNVDGLIMQFQPYLWIHGHIHEPTDYRIGRTHVLSNPRGHPNDLGQSTPWREDIVLDLE